MEYFEKKQSKSGLLVCIPYKYKDLFKDFIGSGNLSWNKKEKAWLVNEEHTKELDEFLSKKDAILSDYDAEFVVAEINSEQRLQNAAKEKIDALVTSYNILTEKQAELEEARKKTDQLNMRVDDQVNAVRKKVDGLINYSAVIDAKTKMTSLIKKVGAKYKDQFTAQQEIINSQREALSKSGLGSKGLDELWYANFNRPDRDDPLYLCDSEIYTIYKLSE